MPDKTTLKTIFHTTATQDLSAGALDAVTAIDFDTQVSYVSIKFSTPVSETVTLTIDSGEGANYDMVVEKASFTSRTNLFWQPLSPLYLKKGTELRVQCTNGGGTGTAYAVIAQVQA